MRTWKWPGNWRSVWGGDDFIQEVEDRIYQVILAEFMRVTEPSMPPVTITIHNVADEMSKVLDRINADLPPRVKKSCLADAIFRREMLEGFAIGSALQAIRISKP